jgi:hypothetical protein
MTYRWITLFKECCIDVIEADLVIQPCGDQGKHEGQEVDEDSDASRVEGQHLLDLNPVELSQIVSEIIFKSN